MSLIVMGCRGSESLWKGTIVEVDGITTVRNPKEPMYADSNDVLSIKQDLSIGVKEGPAEYMFSRLRDLDVDDDGNIYALDQRESIVKVFNSQGTYVRTIGRKGQGPGEFASAYALSVTPQQHLFVNDIAGRKIGIYTLDGEFIRSISTALTRVLFPILDSEECIYDLNPGQGETTGYELRKYSQDLKNQRTLITSPSVLTPQKKFQVYAPIIRFDLGPNDIVVFGYPEEYLIKICDSEGNILRHITREYEAMALTQEEKEAVKIRAPIQDYTYDIPQAHCAYHQITVDDQGWIFVATWEKPDKGYYYDVFAPDGKYFAKVGLLFPPVIMKKNKLYAIESDEEGYEVIRRYEYSISYLGQ
jgi:hypothetical protein